MQPSQLSGSRYRHRTFSGDGRQAFLWPLGFCLLLFALGGCHNKSAGEEEDTSVKTRTPVTITHISFGSLTEYISLNATSQFLQKNYVKANVNGYVTAAYVTLGKHVSQGETLFRLQTKEARSIGNAVNKLDPSFRFSGVNYIRAPSSGYVSQVNHQQGDYVQDGEQLAILNDANSFAFVLNLPYELRPYLQQQRQVQLTLPDNTQLAGIIENPVPTVDPTSQSQQVIIRVPSASGIPENLIAKVRLVKTQKNAAQSLPKAAVLSDDAQTQYWVMQLVNDSTAVKIPVKRGMETKDAVEIISPQFRPADRIVLTGNYGLADTAGVVVRSKSDAQS